MADNRIRDVHAGRFAAVAKLHRVIDLIDEQSPVAVLQYVNRQHTAADSSGCPQTKVVEFRRVEYEFRKTMDKIFAIKNIPKRFGERLEVGR